MAEVLMNPRWRLWLKSDPAVVSNVAFMAWIQERWREYRLERGIHPERIATDAMHDDFDRWLAAKVADALPRKK